jgi:transcriptional regulator with XRE-family HTH domain
MPVINSGASDLMEWREAFNKTLDHFDIKAAEIAERSGVDAVQISKFRNSKKDMHAHNFQKLIDALPSQAKMYFWYLAMSSPESVP